VLFEFCCWFQKGDAFAVQPVPTSFAMVSWSDVCQRAVEKPFQAQLDAVRTSCGVTVSRVCMLHSNNVRFDLSPFFARAAVDVAALGAVLPHLHVVSRIFCQIAAYCICALISGFVLYLLRRMKQEDRQCLWRLYGWFNGLMLCGSCFGAATWSFRMMFLDNAYRSYNILSSNKDGGNFSIATRSLQHSFEARAFEWRTALTVTYPIEFMCLSAAKLMVLDRMLDFAAQAQQGHATRKRLATSARFVMAAVFLGNACGLVASLVAAVYFKSAADAAGTASACFAANDPKQGAQYSKSFQVQLNRGVSIVSYQAYAEFAVLLLIVAAFVASGVLCARRVSKLLGVDSDSLAASAGRQLWLRIVGTSVFVFVAFLLRSAFQAMFAVAQGLQDLNNPKNCESSSLSSLCDSSCYNVYTLMTVWMLLTPEFQMIIVLISTPIALLVALWGMTTRRTVRLLASNQTELASARSTMLRP
jgi:hypothetical protein